MDLTPARLLHRRRRGSVPALHRRPAAAGGLSGGLRHGRARGPAHATGDPLRPADLRHPHARQPRPGTAPGVAGAEPGPAGDPDDRLPLGRDRDPRGQPLRARLSGEAHGIPGSADPGPARRGPAPDPAGGQRLRPEDPALGRRDGRPAHGLAEPGGVAVPRMLGAMLGAWARPSST